MLVFNYPNAGHGFLILFETDDEKRNKLTAIEPNIDFLGGTLEAFGNAMSESYKTILVELVKLKKD